MTNLKWFNLVLRVLMEIGIVVAFGYYGYHAGGRIGSKILLSIGFPLIGFGFWGLVDFHQFGKISEILRLAQELLISGLASVALYITGAPIAGLALGGISIIHHALVYLFGDKLLKK
ncbi:MAG: YrdB family protein [Bacteroidota bacterium]|nr:YrdB family protein [Bacteroidota bacterium]